MIKDTFITKLDKAYSSYINGETSELEMRHILTEFDDFLDKLYDPPPVHEEVSHQDLAKMQWYLIETRENVIQNGRDLVVKHPAIFAKDMRELADYAEEDEGDAHRIADQIICNVLRKLGYGEGVQFFEYIPKRY